MIIGFQEFLSRNNFFFEESVMPENDARSRLVIRSNLPGTNEEEVEDDEQSQRDDDDDNEPPPQFMNV